ncbi:MAG: hypothetical protein Q7Q71_08805 [Verrucomicrobiota bacterium JB023]|nr:hypothetical protein [Verrucomicrobiota bacterium JB023]
MPRASLFVIGLCLVTLFSWLLTSTRADDPPPSEEAPAPPVGLHPMVEEEEFVELAPYMTELQTFTHKLALASKEKNQRLAEFYLYESILLLETIQNEVPEYRGQPIALFVDRMALPAYEQMKETILAEPLDADKLMTDLHGVVASCNQCHAATAHEFIKITPGTEVNPFNQSFKP